VVSSVGEVVLSRALPCLKVVNIMSSLLSSVWRFTNRCFRRSHSFFKKCKSTYCVRFDWDTKQKFVADSQFEVLRQGYKRLADDIFKLDPTTASNDLRIVTCQENCILQRKNFPRKETPVWNPNFKGKLCCQKVLK